MKKMILIFMMIIICMFPGGCGKEANKYTGTWKAYSAEVDGTKFTVDELKAMGDDSMNDIQIVFKDGGKAYVSEGGEGDVVDWSETEDGVKIGEQECTLVDDMICLVYGDAKIYFKKTSKSQTIGDKQKEKSESKAADGKEGGITKQSTEKESEKAENSSENMIFSDSIENINSQLEKDIADTHDALTKEYDQLKADVNTYNKYIKSTDRIEAFYNKISQIHRELCIRMREYSINYAKIILLSDSSNNEKYEELEKLYDDIYDDGGDEIYDDFYDGILDDVYNDFYDGILGDKPDDVEYSEWFDCCSQEYEWWFDTRSDIYEQWFDYRSDVYEFWVDVRSEVFSGDIDKAKESVSDFKKDITELKEKNY